jgi:hypothetical protein
MPVPAFPAPCTQLDEAVDEVFAGTSPTVAAAWT